MISIVISSCLNKEERKEYLLKVVCGLRIVFRDSEIIVCFDKYGESKIDGADVCYTHNNGLGHSWNWGIKNSSNDFVLQMEDDWILKEKYFGIFTDIVNNGIEVIKRFGGIFRLENMEKDWWTPGNTKKNIGNNCFFELNKPKKVNWGNDYLMYYYANHPQLKSKNIHKDKIGLFLENSPPHEVESDMCKKFFDSGEKVFFIKENTFFHIGDIRSRSDQW